MRGERRIWVAYDGGDGKIVLLSVGEELQNIVPDNDALLAGENVLDTHVWRNIEGGLGYGE